jgi:hypothetical protein
MSGRTCACIQDYLRFIGDGPTGLLKEFVNQYAGISFSAHISTRWFARLLPELPPDSGVPMALCAGDNFP